MNPLSQSIKKTLTYFDLFNKPLTTEELYGFLWQPPYLGYEDFVKELSIFEVAESKNGFWFLPGREEIVKYYSENSWLNDKKMCIARSAARKLRSIPFIRAIFVCNSVGMQTANEKSDIDFFIVTAPGRVWIVRFFANTILRLFGLRVYGNVSRDKICLSFFTDEDNLDLSALRVKEDDVHFAYWIKHFVLLFDARDWGCEIIRRNSWLKKFLPYSSEYFLLSPWGVRDNWLSRGWKKFWETVWQGSYGDMLEKQARVIQEKRIVMVLQDKTLLDGQRVVYNNGMVKLHQNDNRAKIYQDWSRRCS